MGENNGEGYKGYKQTTELHFRYASHIAFRYKTDCETRYLQNTSETPRGGRAVSRGSRSDKGRLNLLCVRQQVVHAHQVFRQGREKMVIILKISRDKIMETVLLVYLSNQTMDEDFTINGLNLFQMICMYHAHVWYSPHNMSGL